MVLQIQSWKKGYLNLAAIHTKLEAIPLPSSTKHCKVHLRTEQNAPAKKQFQVEAISFHGYLIDLYVLGFQACMFL